jgi:CBS domain containing-hemolysin-like protein
MAFPDVLDLILRILAIPLLLLANAFFVAAEFSLVMVRPTRVREMVQKSVPRSRLLQKAIADPDRVIAATQVGITIASIGLGWLGEPVLARFFETTLLNAIAPRTAGALAHSLAFGTAFAIITLMHVVLGELVPKSIALQRPVDTGLRVAAPLLVIEWIFRPFIWLLNGTGNWIVRWIGLKPLPPHRQVHSVDEIKMLVAASLQGGALAPDHGELLTRALDLPIRRVRDIMIPRGQIVAVDVHMPQDRLLESVSDQGHTRMPVYDGALDRIVGIVHTKDIFTITASKGLIILEDLVREPYFIAPDVDVVEVLRGFRANRVHLAVVRDAGDHIVGLVTLEDVLQQVVGHIEDDYTTDLDELRGSPEGGKGA